MIIVDSCVLIDLLKKKVDLRDILRPWIAERQIVSCGIIRAEVTRGVRDSENRQRLDRFLSLLPEAPMDAQFWTNVGELAREIDATGKVLPLTDVAIATIAKKRKALLITTDRHFSFVDGVRIAETVPAMGI